MKASASKDGIYLCCGICLVVRASGSHVFPCEGGLSRILRYLILDYLGSTLPTVQRTRGMYPLYFFSTDLNAHRTCIKGYCAMTSAGGKR